MAERRTVRSRADEAELDPPDAEPLDEDEAEDEPRGRRQPRRQPRQSGRSGAAKAAEAGLRQITELTGKRPEGVTAVEPGEDGWIVGVEVVEDQRVPSSSDILAIYEAELDASGNLLSYRRIQRYSRGRGDKSEES
jgi:hypothetical protein